MLLNIHVKNMALIDEAEIDLMEGLNILTGETGAGKSIIIGSVNVALGLEGFKGFAREGADSALVELIFTVDRRRQAKALNMLDIAPEDGEVIISRKLTNGRSVSKINGETVPVSKVRQAAEILIDIHGQHEHQALLHQKNHLEILDEFAGEELKPLKEELRLLYRDFETCRKSWEETDMDAASRAKEVDFLRFETEEIEEADLKPGEDADLEEVYRKLLNGQKILDGLSEAVGFTASEYGGASEQTGRACRALSAVVDYDKNLQTFLDQISEIDSLMNDFNRDVADYRNNLSFDPGEFSKIEERLDLINRLKAKYGDGIEKILAYQKEKEQRLLELEDYENYRSRLKQEYDLSREKLQKSCARISQVRKKAAKLLAERIREELLDLNFLDVRFSISFKEVSPGTDGSDEICFLISLNPGQPLQPLQKVASGGELSRIMLAIKTVLADKDAVGTMIFDEIDVGISGRTAQKVSEKMAVIARSRQVICITHLAQIASMADSHYCIEKKIVGEEAKTFIRQLTEEESVKELARILGGARITDTVLKSAREMKELAVCTKKY